jgi:hypothetical protein
MASAGSVSLPSTLLERIFDRGDHLGRARS